MRSYLDGSSCLNVRPSVTLTLGSNGCVARPVPDQFKPHPTIYRPNRAQPNPNPTSTPTPPSHTERLLCCHLTVGSSILVRFWGTSSSDFPSKIAVCSDCGVSSRASCEAEPRNTCSRLLDILGSNVWDVPWFADRVFIVPCD